MKAMMPTSAMIIAITPIVSIVSPLRTRSNTCLTPLGRPITIPEKISSEMPLPMPRSVICSPSHMTKIVPVVSVRIVLNKNPHVGAPTWGFLFSTILTLTTGTIFVMWLGEQITERGIGNGISLLIFSGIVIGLPNGVRQVFERLHGGDTMET